MLDLANRLREGGIDAEIDQYETSPARRLARWCEQQIKRADFVLLVCTETYRRRFDEAEPGEGWACCGKPRIITASSSTTPARRRSKFIPVLLERRLARPHSDGGEGGDALAGGYAGGYEGCIASSPASRRR